MKASKVILDYFNGIGYKPTILDVAADGKLLIEAISNDGKSYNYQAVYKVDDNKIFEQHKTLTWI